MRYLAPRDRRVFSLRSEINHLMTDQSEQRKHDARRAKAKYESRHKKISVRYSLEDYKSVISFAEKSGKDPSTYVHDISLSPTFKIAPAVPRINIETKAQIQKIGINLNQIARACNNQFENKNYQKIQQELQSMVTVLRMLLDKIE